MPKWLLLALLAGTLHAAVVRGTVVEHQTGRPLARALVVVQPMAGTTGSPQSLHTNHAGVFEFSHIPAGAYLVTVSKRAFATAQYGQKHYKAAGVPLLVDEAAPPEPLSFRLQHFGAITGTVIDENEVGLADHDVAVFRNTRPPQLVGRARTDDRGVYRVGGLEPGSYLVRTLAKQYEDGGYLPTFSRETLGLEEAHPIEVNLEQQSLDVNVRPVPGQLYLLTGQTVPGVPSTITLVSEMGAENVQSDRYGSFQFPPEPPGQYELYAVAANTMRRGGGVLTGYQPLRLDRERVDHRIHLGPAAEVKVILEDTNGQPVDPNKVQILARRRDLSGTGVADDLRANQGNLQLFPGRWELSMAPNAAYYVATFAGPRNDSVERARPDGWNEIILGSSAQETVKFVLSPMAAKVHGVVSNSSHDPVVGAPVFMEAFDPQSHRRLTDLRSTRTDVHGRYEFFGLAPGVYRLLSSFEFQMPDQAALDAAGAGMFKAQEGTELAVDLDLYVIR
jgi:hypothetical protein